MRITSGKYKGRLIKAPYAMRPTQEKVRKAVFDILGDIAGLSFLELFAGSGAVGFEASSRGVRELTLVERDSVCLAAINKNIEALGLASCDVYAKEATEAITAFAKSKKKFNLIFLDPPYYQGMANPRTNCQDLAKSGQSIGAGAKKTLQTLDAYDILAPNGFIITQHFKKDILPDRIGNLALFKQARYGDTLLSFYRRKL